MRSRKLRGFALVAVVAVVGAACDDAKTGLTKEDWIKAAAAICKTGTEDFNALFETDFPTTPEKTAGFFEKATPIFERQMNDLRELEAPEADADAIDKALDAGDRAVADFDAASTDPEKAGEIFGAQGGENITAFEEGLTEVGVPECAQDEAEEEEEEDLPDPATFSPEKKAFVEAADAICQAADDKISPAEDQYLESFPPPLDGWVGFLEVAVPALRDQLEQLGALEPPAEDREAIEALLTRGSGVADVLEEALAAAKAGDQERFDEITQPLFSGEFDDFDRAFREYGFQVCGSEDDDEEE